MSSLEVKLLEALGERVMTVVFAGYLKPQQYASVSQGRMCSDNFTCCHTDMEVADQFPSDPVTVY